jgi:general secretion pathway protein D
MESLIRVNNGDVAVMGGLMQDDIVNKNATVPGLASVPLFGYLFQNRNETSNKTELVILVRPVVVKQASLDGDYKHLRGMLPDYNLLVKPPVVRELGDRDNLLVKPPVVGELGDR